MNALSVVAVMGGGAVDPELIRLISAQEKERRETIEKAVVNLGKNVVTGYRYWKGAPKVLDSSTGQEIKPEDARYAGIMLKYRQEEDVKFAMFENLVNSTVEMALVLSKGSALEMEILARLMQRQPSDNRVSADSARFK